MATKLIVVVRTDLGLGRGKLAAQVAHAAVTATLAGLGGPDAAQWLREGQPKVVLKVPGEPELRTVADQARQAQLPVELICDAGRTQVAAGTLTCCAIGPADAARIDLVTGELSLL